MTLVELLATFAIASIILIVIYSVFTNGIKVSKKVEAESELRDEGDYVVTMIMNKLAETGVDQIKDCSPNNDNASCFELEDNTELKIKKYDQTNSQTKDPFYDVEKGQSPQKTVTTIQLESLKSGKYVLEINGTPIEIENDLAGSTIGFTCSKQNENNVCTSAIISLNLKLTSTSKLITSGLNKDKDPLTINLESQFGF